MISAAREADTFFVLGGTLRRDAPSYITRAADEELLRHTLAGEYCNVLAARQMGKSSLMVRTADRLKTQGVRTAVIDLTAIGSDVTVEEWYFGLVSRLARQLRLEADEQAWWQAHTERSPVQRFSDFAREIVLEEVRDPIVIFVDEIDSTLRLKFTDDFFAAIRAMYNARSSDAAYQRLTIVLLGVARPSDLVKDRTRTPYNIGVSVDLTDFTYDEVKEVFVPVLNAAQAGQGESILKSVLVWTEGQPYLTQKLCAEATAQLKGQIVEEDIDQLVTQLFLTEEARRESNLQAIRDRILSSPYKAPMLKIYRRVLAEQRVMDEERSPEKNELKLTGLVRRTPQGVLAVRNSVYSYVFDLTWVKANLPVNYTKRIAIVAIIVALLATGALVFALSNQQAQAVDVQAKILVDQFNNSLSLDVRLSSLAGLFKLGDTQASQARELFFGLTQADRLALIDPADPQNVQTELAAVIAGLYQYPHCTSAPNEAALLNSMHTALKKIHAVNLGAEIDLWLQARTLAATNPIAAVGVYSTALTTSLNDGRANPNLLFERGMSHAAAQDYEAALADFEAALQLAPDCKTAIVEQVVGHPELAARWGGLANQYPQLSQALPTLTPQPTATMAVFVSTMTLSAATATKTPTPTELPAISPTRTIIPARSTPSPTAPPTIAPPTSAPSISFAADKTTINDNGCVTLSWATNNVKAVYYQDNGVLGNGSRQECGLTSSQTFSLRVVLPTGDEVTRQVTISVATRTPTPTSAPTSTPPLPPPGPVSSDPFDSSQGTVVVSSDAIIDPINAFRINGGFEDGNTLMRNGGFNSLSFITFDTATPVSIGGVRLFAHSDEAGCCLRRAMNHFTLRADTNGDGVFETTAVDVAINPQYNSQPGNNAIGIGDLDTTLPAGKVITAQHWRLEVTQGSDVQPYEGARLNELDAIPAP